jgi:hypothetical protein
MKISTCLILACLFLLNTGYTEPESTAGPRLPESYCISSEEMKLGEMINAYRKSKKLPAIPISASLSYVARRHVYDLDSNFKDNGRCNMHSWSSKGSWSSCCYTEDHKKAECMWNKPRELTSYKGNGYEIACSSTGNLTPAESLKCWKESPSHHAVMISSGIWKAHPWKAMGVGIYKGYAVVWFGEEPDASEIRKCN